MAKLGAKIAARRAPAPAAKPLPVAKPLKSREAQLESTAEGTEFAFSDNENMLLGLGPMKKRRATGAVSRELMG